jgi:hypothetical protein
VYARGRTFFPCEEIVLIVPLATLKALPLGTMLARFTVPRKYLPALPMFDLGDKRSFMLKVSKYVVLLAARYQISDKDMFFFIYLRH